VAICATPVRRQAELHQLERQPQHCDPIGVVHRSPTHASVAVPVPVVPALQCRL
jgi:hypothetical protein